MTDFSVATFNVKNLIGANAEYYRFQIYTDEEYAWKKDWTADQIVRMNPDIIGFQEVFEKPALQDVIDAADRQGNLGNAAALPDQSKSYRKRAIFRRLAYESYADARLAFAPNSFDGDAGNRRPGLAILSRFGFLGEPEFVQDLETPLEIDFSHIGGGAAGNFVLARLSRPILKVRVPIDGRAVTVFNCHLKSKLGEFIRNPGDDFAPEADLTNYDPVGRAMGALRAGLRRMAEARVLRGLIVEELKQGNPTIVMGDFNDSEHAVSSEIISGERPFKNYSWMLRHDSGHRNDRYSREENEVITDAVNTMKLTSAEALFVRKSLRDMIFTSAFGGVYESIDQILLSQNFHPDNPDRIGEMEYLSVFNDHLTDGSHPEAPYNKLASDHGQLMAHIRLV